ncbi:3'-5' exonuclease [Candidatus Mycalebacterium sp.]
MPDYVLAFDIETIPDVEGLRNLYDFPSDLSDGEVVTNTHKLRKDETGKSSEFLPPFLQKVVTISYVLRNFSGRDNGKKLEISSFCGQQKDESQLIADFFKIIDSHTPQLVSWNGSGFDLPVLNHRAMINGITARTFWETEDDFKWNNYSNRYHERHLDLMDALSMYQYSNRSKLSDFAKMCGFSVKTGIAGNEIWNAWQDGRLQEIKEHCETDVLLTYFLYVKFQQLRGILDFGDEISFVKEHLQKMEGDHWKEVLDSMQEIDGGKSEKSVETIPDRTEKLSHKKVRRRKDGNPISEKTTDEGVE